MVVLQIEIADFAVIVILDRAFSTLRAGRSGPSYLGMYADGVRMSSGVTASRPAGYATLTRFQSKTSPFIAEHLQNDKMMVDFIMDS
jgi:hypothetical protein